MKFHVAEIFLFNFCATGEKFGLRIVKQLKKGPKKVKGSQKKVTKTKDTFTLFDLFGHFYFLGGERPLPPPVDTPLSVSYL